VKRFDGRVALITGGASGIGQACAERLAAEGASVVIADVSDDSATCDRITAAGGETSQVRLDVRERDDWMRAVDHTVEAFGRLDWLGNVASVSSMSFDDTVLGLTDENWEVVMNTNVRGMWLGMQTVIPVMQKQRGGRIVNMASLLGLRGLPGMAVYSMSKGAIVSLTIQAAVEYASDNILINAICPGSIDTPMLTPHLTPEWRTQVERQHTISRLGRPEEVAGKLAYFMSDDGDFSTGQVEFVDGGWSTRAAVAPG
jgi:NAD(P)-dependent dehydrogenase (short-subunit alcohol dehydrogenase family)